MHRRTRSRTAITRALLVGVLLGGAPLSACHDGITRPGRALQAMGDRQFLVGLTALPTGEQDTWIIHARLRSGALAGAVGGFRARLILPADVTLAQDPSSQRDALGAMTRLVHVDGRDVRIVGVSPEGVAMGDLFAVSVRGSARSLSGLRLELDELVDARGENRRASTLVVEKASVESAAR